MSQHNRGIKCTDRNDCICPKCCLCHDCLFTRRSTSLYSGLVSRLKEKKWKTGKRAGTVRKEKQPIPFTAEEFRAWLRVVLEDSPSCEYCKDPINISTISPDHYIPISRGGSLDRANLRGCCKDCNNTKGSLLPGEFRALMDGLKTFSEAGRMDILRRLRGGIRHFGRKTVAANSVVQESPTAIVAYPAALNPALKEGT